MCYLMVALQESVGIAKALAAKNGYDLDSNQEVSFKQICCVLTIGDRSMTMHK